MQQMIDTQVQQLAYSPGGYATGQTPRPPLGPTSATTPMSLDSFLQSVGITPGGSPGYTPRQTPNQQRAASPPGYVPRPPTGQTPGHTGFTRWRWRGAGGDGGGGVALSSATPGDEPAHQTSRTPGRTPYTDQDIKNGIDELLALDNDQDENHHYGIYYSQIY